MKDPESTSAGAFSFAIADDVPEVPEVPQGLGLTPDVAPVAESESAQYVAAVAEDEDGSEPESAQYVAAVAEHEDESEPESAEYIAAVAEDEDGLESESEPDVAVSASANSWTFWLAWVLIALGLLLVLWALVTN